jgi:glycyl-tRNA synthetase beta chain
MSKLILEIGVEEIPADYLAPAINQLKEEAKKALDAKLIGYSEISGLYTVRRFILLIDGLEDKQKDLSFEKKGPRYDIAYKDGDMTDIGKTFLAKNNINEKELKIKEEKGQKYLFIDVFEKGRPVKKVLSEILPELIRGMRFPKSMVWDDSLVTFARPIRWILCMLDTEAVHFNFGRIQSGNLTRLHKFIHDNKAVPVKDADDYLKQMVKNGIILSQEARRNEIRFNANSLLKKSGLVLMEDDDLLESLASSVESVTAMTGTFDEKFLFLPKEVIITAMREHQRYFAVSKEDGTFTNRFVNIRDGGDKNNDFIAKQHAKVLYSRLYDAEFFYKEDLKTPLENNNEKLKEAIFITGLGTMYEKMERLKMMAARSKDLFGYADPQILSEAASFSKADLMTNMVGEKEYASLRGFMGGVYLAKQGKEEKVWKAVSEHYLPNMAGDKLPSTAEGVYLSMIDKMDNIVGFYIAGFKPTGSKDPYAVRRQVLNIIYTVMEKQINLDLAFFIYENALAYKKQLGKDTDTAEIIEFFRQREINYFREKGIDYDIISSVCLGKVMNINDDFKKAEMFMEDRKDTKDFNAIVFAVSRMANIVPAKYETGKTDRSLFDAPEEGVLYDKFTAEKNAVENMIIEKRYKEAFDRIASFKPAIDEYFNKVMVMAEDITKKNNRLNMMAEIRDVFYKLADFSKIVVDRK